MNERARLTLHPGAWWIWALGLVAVATRSTHPLVTGSVIAVAGLAVALFRSGAEWARGYRAYLLLAAAVVGIRVGFRILLGGDFGTRTVFSLPELNLPGAAGPVGGAVTVEEILAGLYDGLRLGAIVVCVGAANTLADPRRLVGSLPRAIGAMATSVAVALALAPQLIESLVRVRRARRLRGEQGGGWRTLRSLLVPVLEDTLSRSLALAASMDARGYGHRSADRPATAWQAWTGLALLAMGVFALLTIPNPYIAVALVGAALVLVGTGLRRLGSSIVRTRYRPEAWTGRDWWVALAGLAAAGGVALAGALQPGILHPSLQPLTWPPVPVLAMVSIGLALAIPALVLGAGTRVYTAEGAAT